MVSTQNTSRSHANPPRMQSQQGDIDSRPPRGTLETLHANTDEMEALRLTNQCLLRELEQLTRQMQSPQEARQTREGYNPITPEEQQYIDPPRKEDGERETSQAREHDPYKPPGENHNEERHDRDNISDEPIPYHQETRERSREQRFKDIQQELSHMKEVVKGRALVSMDAMVQQTESPFTVGVLYLSHPDSRFDPNGESEQGSRRETIYWIGTLYLLYQTLVCPSLITVSTYRIQKYKIKLPSWWCLQCHIHIVLSPIYIYKKNYIFTFTDQTTKPTLMNPYSCVIRAKTVLF